MNRAVFGRQDRGSGAGWMPGRKRQAAVGRDPIPVSAAFPTGSSIVLTMRIALDLKLRR